MHEVQVGADEAHAPAGSVRRKPPQSETASDGADHVGAPTVAVEALAAALCQPLPLEAALVATERRGGCERPPTDQIVHPRPRRVARIFLVRHTVAPLA